MGTPANWVLKIEKSLTEELRAFGPQEAPKGFFGPGVKGPKYSHIGLPELPKKFDETLLVKYRPTVCFVYFLDRLCTKGVPAELSKVTASVDDLMMKLSTASCPLYIFTPVWLGETGEKTLAEKGPRYETCKQAAAIIREAAAKHGISVIDLFAMCEQEYATNNELFFGGEYAKKKGTILIAKDGSNMIKREIKKVLGLLDSE